MTATKRKFLVRRIVASAIVAALLGVGLARAFSGGSPPPPPDSAAQLVPASALIYLNLGTSSHGTQWKHTAAAMTRLPITGQLRDALVGAVTGSALGNLDLNRDVKPWLGNEAAYAQLPGKSENLLLFRVRDQRAAIGAFTKAAGASAPTPYKGTLLRNVGGGSVAGVTGGWAFIGAPDAVHAALDTKAQPAGSLARNATYSDLSGGLPNDRVGNAWLSQGWMQAHLAGPAAILAGAARVPAFQSAAVGFGDDGKVMRLAFRGRPAPGSAGPGCTGEAGQSGSLIDKAPAQPALFLGMGGAECVLRDLMSSPTSAIGRALQSFGARAQRAGVSMDRDLLPLFGGDSSLSLTQGPTITVDAGDVPAQQSLNIMGRLQSALVGLLNPEAGGTAPGFGAQTVNGVTAMTASLTPGLQLSYAAFGGDLVASTALNGIADATKGQHLAQSKDFKTVLGDRPKSPSAVLFVDLQKFLALADQAGLGSNPTYAAVRDDLAKVGAAGAVLSREGNDIDAELRLKNP
jgi:uncharacterized protein DUF3352